MNQTALRVRLLTLLESASVHGDVSAITPDTHLLRSGVLDSLGVVELADAIERSFGIALPKAAVNPATFKTLKTIEETLQHYGGQSRE